MLSVTCNMSVVFSGTPVSSTNKTERHDITKSGVKHHKPTNLEVSDYCITPNEQIYSYIMTRTSHTQWDDDGARLVGILYSASSPQQRSSDRDFAPLRHIILISSQQVLLLLLNAVHVARNNKYQFHSL